MGSHANAMLAWGIDLGDPYNTVEGFDWREIGTSSHEFEDRIMPGLFGFTESLPSYPGHLDPAGRREWHESVREPYQQRRDATVPVTFKEYGYENDGTALVLRRSCVSVPEEGVVAVDPAVLATPTPDEVAAFTTVIDRLGYDGGPVRLLLMASYG